MIEQGIAVFIFFGHCEQSQWIEFFTARRAAAQRRWNMLLEGGRSGVIPSI